MVEREGNRGKEKRTLKTFGNVKEKENGKVRIK